MDDRLFIKLIGAPVAGWFAASAYGVATAAPGGTGLFAVSLVGCCIVVRLLYRAWRAGEPTSPGRTRTLSHDG